MVTSYFVSKHPKDTGCKYADEFLGRKSSCLECPFKDCLLDEPAKVRFGILKAKRNQEILSLFYQDVTLVNIAKRFGIHARTVQRVVDRSNK